MLGKSAVSLLALTRSVKKSDLPLPHGFNRRHFPKMLLMLSFLAYLDVAFYLWNIMREIFLPTNKVKSRMINFIAENSYVFFKKKSYQNILQTVEVKEYFAHLSNNTFPVKSLYMTTGCSKWKKLWHSGSRPLWCCDPFIQFLVLYSQA